MSNTPWYSSDRLTRRGYALLAAGFVAVGVYYWAACRPAGFQGGDVVNIATMLAKDGDRALFARDFTFATTRYYGTYLPVYRAALRGLSWAVGGVLRAHKLLILCAVPVYLGAMFLLLNELTRNWAAAAATAVVSLTLRGSMHYSWGMGPVSAALARTWYLALAPAFMFMLLRWGRRPRVRALLFVLVGLSFNLHPLSAVGCVVVLALFMLYTGGLARSNVRRIAALVVVFGLFALPSGVAHLRSRPSGRVRGADAVEVNRILRHRFPFLFLDTGTFRLSYVGGWLWVTTALGIVAKARVRGLDERDGGLLAAGTGVLALSLLGTAALTMLSDRVEAPRLLCYSLRWAKLVFLVHYVFLAQLVAALFAWSSSAKGGWQRWASCAAAWVVVGAMLAQGVGSGSEAWRAGHAKASGHEAARLDLAMWAREHTSRDALFHFDDPRFRLDALRGLTVCWKDGGAFWHSDPCRLIEWWRRLQSHHDAMASRSPRRVLRLAVQYRADYLVLPRDFGPLAKPVAYENSHFVAYRLLRSPEPGT